MLQRVKAYLQHPPSLAILALLLLGLSTILTYRYTHTGVSLTDVPNAYAQNLRTEREIFNKVFNLAAARLQTDAWAQPVQPFLTVEEILNKVYDSAGQFLRTSGGGGSGSGTPGGSNTQLQYNNAGAFGGIAPLTWDGSNIKVGYNGTTQLRFIAPNSANAPFVMNYVQNINPGEPSRTDDTFQWGYNRDPSGAKIDNAESAFSYHLETHWTDPSYGPTMEHYLVSNGINGAGRRIFFLQTLKSNGAQTIPWMWGLTNGLGMQWNSEDLQTYWAQLNETGLDICATCAVSKSGAGTNILVQDGTSLIRKDNATDVTIAPTGGHIVLGQNAIHNVTVPGSAKFITNGIFTPNGPQVLDFGGSASAVNYYSFSTATAGNSPEIRTLGDDAAVPLTLRPKGTGSVEFQISGNNNAYFSSGGTRFTTNVMIGPANYTSNAPETLRVYNKTTTTGITKAVIQAGEGQSTTNLQEWRDNSDAILSNVTATGGLQIQKHVESRGTTPAVAGSCGTSPTIVGTDVAGKVTTGTGSPTSCTITFATAWTNAPACMVTNETTPNLARAVSTTTTVILSGTLVAGDVLAYICFGRI